MRGQVVSQITVYRRDLRVPVPHNFEDRLAGQRIERLHRRGKYIVGFTTGVVGFVLHLGMSGRIKIYAPQDSYRPEKHDHVVLMMENGTQIVFHDPRRFGMLYLIDQASWATESPFASMGPEPLSAVCSSEELAARLAGRRMNIKAALLDQKMIAGVGNIYACEALYQACIHPDRLAGTLSVCEVAALVRAVQDVLRRAIEAGGSTLKDYAHTDGRLGYFQHQFAVYDQAGAACPDCACDLMETGGVQRIVQSGRSTFYCPQRQKPL